MTLNIAEENIDTSIINTRMKSGEKLVFENGSSASELAIYSGFYNSIDIQTNNKDLEG